MAGTSMWRNWRTSKICSLDAKYDDELQCIRCTPFWMPKTGEIVDDGKCRWKFLWVLEKIIAQHSSSQLTPEGARSGTSKNGAYPWVLSAGTPSFLPHSFTEHVMIWWLLLESPISVKWSNLHGSWPKSPCLRSWKSAILVEFLFFIWLCWRFPVLDRFGPLLP